MSDALSKLDSLTGGKAGAAVAVIDAATGGKATTVVNTAESSARAFAQSQIDNTLAQKVEAVATNIAKKAVDKGLAAIPSREELKELGQEIAQQLLYYLRTQVLSKIYFDVSEEVRLNGFTIGDARKAQMYATFISKIPQAQALTALGLSLTVNIRAVVQAALPPVAFNKVVDDAAFLLSTIADTVKPEAIKIGRRFASSFVLLGIIAGSALTYGFVRLYDSTSDAPFRPGRKN